MHVNILLFAVICVAAARPNPKTDIDGVDGDMYEIPEYVDPALAMLQLSAMNALPLLTFMEMGGEPEDSLIKGDSLSSDQIGDVKSRLEDVISRLDMAISKVEEGDKHIFVDLDKTIYNLKNIQRYLQRDTLPVRVSLRKSVALTGKLNDLTTTDKSLSTQPIIGSDDMITVYPLPETNLEISDSGESIPCTQNCTAQPQPETPPPARIMIRIPLDNPTVMTETKKYEDAGKAIFRKKWTWKSSSFV